MAAGRPAGTAPAPAPDFALVQPGKPAPEHLTITGQVFPDGLTTRSGTVLFLRLDGGSTTFSATIGVDDNLPPAPPPRGNRGAAAAPGSIVFRIIGDGRELFLSDPKRAGGPPEAITVDTRGVKTLALQTRMLGNNARAVNADWALAQFDVSGAAPAAIPLPPDEPVILTPKPGPAPRINGPTLTGVTAGHPVLYKIPATGTAPLSYSVDGLPPGLAVEAKSGIISGVIAAPGVYPVTLRATNAVGTATRSFTFDARGVLALTPALGWNSWNCFGVSVTDAQVRQAADAMVAKGLIDHGWTYINIDDGWERRPNTTDGVFGGPTRDAEGNILPNSKFPDMPALTAYVHRQGLKIGIYSSPGPTTCQRLEATWQHEEKDAQQWANWGFDYIKYDWCSYSSVLPTEERNNPPLATRQRPYQVLRAALNQAPRDLIFSLCQYGAGNVWEWGAAIGGNSWRTTGDITDTWGSMSTIGFAQVGHSQYAGPGHWNDPDMLVVGKVGWGPRLRDSHLSPNEQYVHLTLWTLLASPLLIGCDMTQMDDFTVGLLTNDAVLAVHQDPLGRAADRVAQEGLLEVWARPLADGTQAVGLFNRDEMATKVAVKFAELKLTGRQQVEDLWRQQDLGTFDGGFTAEVPRHGCLLIKLTPAR